MTIDTSEGPEDLLLDVGYLLQASKNRSYQRHIRESVAVLFRFLQSSGLTVKPVPTIAETVPADFILCGSHLTPEGESFYPIAEERFFRVVDRGVDPEKTTVLHRALREFRSRK